MQEKTIDTITKREEKRIKEHEVEVITEKRRDKKYMQAV